MERYSNQDNARNYSNLAFYRSHNPPNYGKGINAPYFSSSPMRSPFARGEIQNNTVFQNQSCDTYNTYNKYNLEDYVNPKMMRQKK